jgi:hypothetical protein
LYLAWPAGSTRPPLVLGDIAGLEYPVAPYLFTLQAAGGGQLPDTAYCHAKRIRNLGDVH